MKTFKNLHPYSKKKIRLEEVIRIEADINYSHLVLNTGKRIMLARTLKAYENDLTLPFLRVNKSCMVNLHYLVQNSISASNSVKMIDGYVAKISRRRVEFVSAAISSAKS
jgi:DNA-binding LytR/AlgR family response regulator